jgi:hypothetical protein
LLGRFLVAVHQLDRPPHAPLQMYRSPTWSSLVCMRLQHGWCLVPRDNKPWL